MAYRVQTTQLSFTTGQSSAIALDPTAKTTCVQLTQSTTTSSLDCIIQVTLDDPIASTTIVWSGLSTTHYSSQTAMIEAQAGGVFLTVLSPIAGLRISASTQSTANVLTLKALQSVTA